MILLDVGVLLEWLSIAVVDVVGYCFCDILHYFVVVDVNSLFFPLDVAILLVDVALDAFLDDNFVVSSLVRDEDVDLETLDVHFGSDVARCLAMMNIVFSEGFVDALACDVGEFVGESSS